MAVSWGGNVITKHAHIGAHDIVNTDYEILPYLFGDLITENDVIVDVGCGKGRVINWLLSRKIQNRIIGIELNPEIAARTKKRLRKFKNVEIISGNILECLPENGILFYLYNPFDATVMERFKSLLYDKLGSTPNLSIIYHNCHHLDCFANDPRFIVSDIKIPSIRDRSALIRLK
ncbi:class I SAM-dependent methyltransferase [Desulfobacterales bacterium HSG17]|nr:class I SAM-dependent methyltransferase [Desulfobacterales bacterium HSG17]